MASPFQALQLSDWFPSSATWFSRPSGTPRLCATTTPGSPTKATCCARDPSRNGPYLTSQCLFASHSRFGKYIKLQYSSDNQLVGAQTEHFLLEKSRLVTVDNNERNYHIFYMLVKGLDEAAKAELCLGECEDYVMLNQGRCITISDEVDDKVEYMAVNLALNVLGITPEEKWQLFSILVSRPAKPAPHPLLTPPPPRILTLALPYP